MGPKAIMNDLISYGHSRHSQFQSKAFQNVISEGFCISYQSVQRTLYLSVHCTCPYIAPVRTLYLSVHCTCPYIVPVRTLYLSVHCTCPSNVPIPKALHG